MLINKSQKHQSSCLEKIVEKARKPTATRKLNLRGGDERLVTACSLFFFALLVRCTVKLDVTFRLKIFCGSR